MHSHADWTLAGGNVRTSNLPTPSIRLMAAEEGSGGELRCSTLLSLPRNSCIMQHVGTHTIAVCMQAHQPCSDVHAFCDHAGYFGATGMHTKL